MASISVCMIVKNEENVLARCLDSLKNIWDELIIVDTGSGDRTKEIALQYTEKVYDFRWTGSFSDARNFSFSKAAMDYIYVADADEVLDEENQKKFLMLKQALLPEVEIVQMKYGNQLSFGTVYNFDEEYRPKLYKRVRSFQWIEPIHEMVRLDPVVFDSDIVITHRPAESHTRRDIQAFENLVRKEGGMSSRLFEMYARELFVSGTEEDFLKAEDYFDACAEKLNPEEDSFIMACCAAAKAAEIRDDVAEFFKYAFKVTAVKSCSEICLEMGRFYMKRREWKEAAVWLYNAAYETVPVLNIKAGNEWPLQLLVQCYREQGEKTQAKIYEKELENRT